MLQCNVGEDNDEEMVTDRTTLAVTEVTRAATVQGNENLVTKKHMYNVRNPLLSIYVSWLYVTLNLFNILFKGVILSHFYYLHFFTRALLHAHKLWVGGWPMWFLCHPKSFWSWLWYFRLGLDNWQSPCLFVSINITLHWKPQIILLCMKVA